MVTVDFGEAVDGFTAADITVTGGTKSGFTGADGDSTYTVTVAPSGNADIAVSVNAGAATDLAGNASLAAASDLTVTYDAGIDATLSLNLGAYSFAENALSGVVTVTVNNAVAGGFTVTPTLTPTHGDHVLRALNFINLPDLAFDGTAGESETLTLQLSDDSVAELPETYTLTLAADNERIDATATATVTVTDSEAVPVLSVTDATAPEGESLEFTVSLSVPVAGGVEVTAAFTNGTAGAGDYANAAQTLSFGQSDTEKTLTVAATSDTLAESDETFTVTLTADPEFVNAAAATATGTITNVSDDSTAPTVASIVRHDGNSAQAEHTSADTLSFRVTFSEAVENVSADGSDFDATGTSNADASAAAAVTGSDTQYIVTVSGGDLASHNGVVGLTFASGQGIDGRVGQRARRHPADRGELRDLHRRQHRADGDRRRAGEPRRQFRVRRHRGVLRGRQRLRRRRRRRDRHGRRAGLAQHHPQQRHELHRQHHPVGDGQRHGPGARRRGPGRRRQRQRGLGAGDGDLRGAGRAGDADGRRRV